MKPYINLPAVVEPEAAAATLAEHPHTRVVDVRTPAEFETVHIRGAYNVPLDTLEEHAAELRAHLDEPLVLVCQSGQRARKAEALLRTAGMERLHLLDGGIQRWEQAGLPVRRGAKKVSLERQVRMVAGGIAAASGLLAVVVDPAFGWIAAMVGGGLVFAGVTDTCGMAMLLAKLPYNGGASCDVNAVVRALSARGDGCADRPFVRRTPDLLPVTEDQR